MTSKKIVISGTGCALGDFVYNGVSFHSPEFIAFRSERPGDGGLSPGKLVFTEELEKFSGISYQEILKKIIGDRQPDAFNVGGPSLVSLIHASQLLRTEDYEVRYFGMAGEDEIARKIFQMVRKTSLNIDNYLSTNTRESPFTYVLSDPDYDNGHGERTFVNNIGAAWDYSPENIPEDFFKSDIVCFGGTGLVPHIHSNLTSLLQKAKTNNCLTVINTVFDFLNEKTNPDKPWPLIESRSYSLVDILIMDRDEALRISGRNSIESAAEYFVSTEVSSFIITNGANDIIAWSGGKLFKKTAILKLPVSKKVTDLLKSGTITVGDTTGCGDNFAGGVIASMAWQLKRGKKDELDLIDAISWGIASGGFTCFIVGGTYLEKEPGEKFTKVDVIRKEYQTQIKFPG